MKREELIKLYQQYCGSFQRCVSQYKDKLELEFIKAERTVVREELCIGSDMILGYYCPSPVQDLLIGNVQRGKILKRVTKRSRPCIKYGFSSDHRMAVFVEFPEENDIRGFALYGENMVTYLCFRKEEGKAEIEWMVQAEFDMQGRIICYTEGLFFDEYCTEINQEIYTYHDEKMERVLLWSCLPGAARFIGSPDGTSSEEEEFVVSQDTYRLQYDQDGYLVGFESLDEDLLQGKIYKIAPGKRRKSGK